jgi:acetylornithine/succinyldiaminopimelate/putrescine aminotransferase
VVLKTVADPAFLKGIAEKGEKIAAAVRGWKHPKVKEVRDRGLMTGVDIAAEAWPVLEAAVKRAGPAAPGLLLLSAGPRTLRLLPPYTISGAEIDLGLEIIKEILDKS